ncbi:MAG: hypothetical protein V3V00_03065 [Saprospiraceae bacterium]
MTSTDAQTVAKFREAQLEDGRYSISGKAILEELSNGNIRLRLSEDYSTPRGPDVQVFLSNSPTDIGGALFVENIAMSDGFSGAQEWNLGTKFTISEYDYIIFRCVAFNLFWAGGTFDALNDDGGGNNGGGENMDTCIATIAATTNWGTLVDICPSDGNDDIIPLKNTEGIPTGDRYAYVLTNTRGDIIKLHFEDTYNFEGSGASTMRIYGISYSGNLTYSIGDTWTTIQSDGCIVYSDSEIYLTVTKDACVEEPKCMATNVASTNWITDISICPTDGISDSVQLQNNLFIPAGDKYAYVFTDENKRIKFLHFEDWFDFEGSSTSIDYVYGVSYEGTLSYNVGDSLSSIIADGCAIISSEELFIKVTKSSCAAETGTISGKVSNFRGDGVSGVTLTLNSGAVAMTNSDGVYIFNDLLLNLPYTLRPSKEDSYGNGVSAQDLVIMSRHILGIKVFDSPYLLIAADANKDTNVSALDIINFINIIIGKTDQLSNNTSWRFVPDSKSFGDGDDPFDFIEKDAVQNLTSDVTNLNFTAVKIGDLSGNANVN